MAGEEQPRRPGFEIGHLLPEFSVADDILRDGFGIIHAVLESGLAPHPQQHLQILAGDFIQRFRAAAMPAPGNAPRPRNSSASGDQPAPGSGKSDDEKMVPRILNPSTRGISMPNPAQECARSSRRNPSTTLATGG